jgi:hypothetical protein
MLVSEDGNASIWGPGSRGFKGESHFPREPSIRWTQWSDRAALAAGALVQGNCAPSCAQGTFVAYPISIKLWREAMVHGQRIFTRFSYTFRSARPRGMPRTVLASAIYEHATSAYGGSPAHWGWDPRF